MSTSCYSMLWYTLVRLAYTTPEYHHHHHHQIAQTAEVRCVNPEWPRRRALDHSVRLLKGVPSPIFWIHEQRGRPGCQPGPKRWPVLAAATCDNARWAGVWSSSLTTWPNSEFRLMAMTSRTEGRLVRSTTSVFLTKSCQRIPRIRWHHFVRIPSSVYQM